jgi:HEPN domain-containing protein
LPLFYRTKQQLRYTKKIAKEAFVNAKVIVEWVKQQLKKSKGK